MRYFDQSIGVERQLIGAVKPIVENGQTRKLRIKLGAVNGRAEEVITVSVLDYETNIRRKVGDDAR